jgi:predicted metal-dependent hydrolase
MHATVTYGSHAIDYEVVERPGRRTLGVEVHPDGRVVVRAPSTCSADVVATRVRRRAPWILRQLADFSRYTPRTPARRYVSGETHMYLGRQYRLKLMVADRSGVALTRGQLAVRMPGEPDSGRARVLLQRWFMERSHTIFGEVLDVVLSRFPGISHPRLIVRSMQSRWGSLSPMGTMTLNPRLVCAPRSCIEYVVAHELCHFRQRDHNARFFRLLGQVMPDWQARKQRLESALL